MLLLVKIIPASPLHCPPWTISPFAIVGGVPIVLCVEAVEGNVLSGPPVASKLIMALTPTHPLSQTPTRGRELALNSVSLSFVLCILRTVQLSIPSPVWSGEKSDSKIAYCCICEPNQSSTVSHLNGPPLTSPSWAAVGDGRFLTSPVSLSLFQGV